MADMQDIENIKYIVCCPLCDNPKCVKGTEDCEAEQWQRKKESEADMEEYIAEEIIEKELQLMDKLLDELAKKESEEVNDNN